MNKFKDFVTWTITLFLVFVFIAVMAAWIYTILNVTIGATIWSHNWVMALLGA